MKLADKVDHMFRHCLFDDDEDKSNAVIVEGIVHTFGFHPERLKEFGEGIREALDMMSPEFHESGGGGWTFLNMCTDKNGDLWTGSHAMMEQLVCLGIALGCAKYTMQRDMWNVLPGGMPYVSINTKKLKE